MKRTPSSILGILIATAVAMVALLWIAFSQSGLPSTNPQPVRLLSEEQLPQSVDQLRQKITKLIQEEQFESATDMLRRVDLDRLINQAVQANDLRWMAVYEDDLVLPGLDEMTRVTVRGDQYWVIPGTSDVLFYPGWQSSATEFARRYNKLLKERLAGTP